MKKTLYCGIDLHSTNGMYVVTDVADQVLLKKRIPNDLPKILSTLEPYRTQLVTVVVESTYNCMRHEGGHEGSVLGFK